MSLCPRATRALAALAIALLPPAAARAEISAGADLEAASRYVWRGFLEYDEPSVQPALLIGSSGFELYVWSLFTLEEAAFGEANFYLSYTRGLGPLELTAGYVYYLDDGGPDSQEVYLQASLEHWLGPRLELAWDFEEGSGRYAELALGPTLPLTPALSLQPAVALGYNDRLFLDESRFSHLQPSLALHWAVSGALSARVRADYVVPLKHDPDDGIDEVFTGTLGLSWTLP
jgi:hypothetical protein